MISLKKLLAGVLSAAMVLGTMAIPAFADGDVAKIGDQGYSTLKDAVAAANTNDTIEILSDVTESIEIAADKNITLDLNGKTLTNTKDANTITNNGTLEIVDSSEAMSGTVDNVSNARGALVNTDGAKAVLNGGTFKRSEETGIDQNNSGDNSWYTIANNGTIEINKGVTVENKGYFSSNMVTGYYNSPTGTGTPTITINGGTFTGGVKTVKVDECGVLVINDGTFTNEKYSCIMNWNKTTINGGTFTSQNDYSVLNGAWNENATGELRINDGTFTGDISGTIKVSYSDVYTGKITAISGGTFDTDVSKYATADRTVMQNPDGTYTVSVAKIGNQGYSTLKDAVDAAKENETVTLLHDTEGDGIKVSSNRNFTIDFGGHTYKLDNPLVGSSKEYETNGFQLLKDSTIVMKNGSLYSEKANILIQNYSNLTLENMNLSLNRHHENKNQPLYTLSNNNGNIVLTGDTNISALERNIAFDVCRYASYPGVSVTMDENMTGKIDGNIELSGKKTANDFKLIIKNGTVNGKIINKATDVTVQISGGTFPSQDVTEYTADGYYYDAKDKTVKKSAAKVIDNAKSAGVKVTLDNLEKNSAIDKTADATYNVVLDTVKSDDKAKVDKIKNDNPNKTVIAYDIYVAKTENGVTTEVKNLEKQKLTLSLPTKANGEVDVYHIDNSGTKTKIDGVTVSGDGMSVSFIAPSFSTYTFVYDAANLTADDITKNIKVEFEQVTDSEYDIVLKATDGDNKINGLLTADLTFSLEQGTGLVNYEITPAANMSLLVNGNRYTFSFDGTNAHSATGDEIVIGKVKFNGYCTRANFKVVDTATTNLVNTTKAVNSIVESYIANGDGTNTGILNAAASIYDINLTQETANLTVNVSFPNAIKDNAVAYQDMKVTVSGNGITEEAKLGTNGVKLYNGVYSVSFNGKLVKGNTYTVTVEGAGYRTARYTVSMTGNKTLNFWNNVKTAPMVIEKDSTGTGVNTNFLAGDIVKDGQINIYDLSAVVSYFGQAGIDTSKVSQYAKYDLNRDGVIDSMDISYVLVSWGK